MRKKLISRLSHFEMRLTTVLIVLLGAQLACCQVNLALNRPTSQISLNYIIFKCVKFVEKQIITRSGELLADLIC